MAQSPGDTLLKPLRLPGEANLANLLIKVLLGVLTVLTWWNLRMLFICLPDTPETEGLIGEREISLLPPGAVIVNVGRPLLAAHGCLALVPAVGFCGRRRHRSNTDMEVW